jgi:hypothetical protein
MTMSRQRKMKFESWKEAEAAYCQESKDRAILDSVVRELVIGKVDWIQGDLIQAHRKVGVCQLDRAHGGIVIIQEYGFVSAKYLESWVDAVIKIPAPMFRHKHESEYKNWLDIQTLAKAARQRRDDFLERKAIAECVPNRLPMAPLVDQNIRTY